MREEEVRAQRGNAAGTIWLVRRLDDGIDDELTDKEQRDG
jgi:hypothetical protein